MTAQLGRGGVVLVVLCAVSAVLAYVLREPHRTQNGRELVVWTFDRATVVSTPETFSGRPLTTTLTPSSILVARLGARDLAYRRSKSPGPSHLVEIELNSFSQFLRGDESSTFLSPIDDAIAQAIPAARTSSWRYKGILLAVPRDLHPVFLAYRADLWNQAGLTDPGQCASWEELFSLCREYETRTGRKSMELPRTSGHVVWMMLQQLGLNVVDETGKPYLSDPLVADMVLFYARWLGQDLGLSPARTMTETTQQLRRGDIAMLMLADWRLGHLRAADPEVCRGLTLMPLPVPQSGARRTATWGGTGLAIPADTPDAAASRALLEFLVHDRESAMNRYRETLVLPADSALWTDPQIESQDNAAAGPPALSALLRDLAPQVPAVVMVPKTQRALMELNVITTRAILEARHSDPSADQLRGSVIQWLEAAQSRLLAD